MGKKKRNHRSNQDSLAIARKVLVHQRKSKSQRGEQRVWLGFEGSDITSIPKPGSLRVVTTTNLSIPWDEKIAESLPLNSNGARNVASLGRPKKIESYAAFLS
jgi:hypothetical protein